MAIVTLEGSALSPAPVLEPVVEVDREPVGPLSRWDAAPFDDIDDPNAFAFPRQVDPVQPIEFICQGCFLVLSSAVRSPTPEAGSAGMDALGGSRSGFCVDCV